MDSASLHNLDRVFGARSIAIVGISDEVDSVGRLVLRNILEGEYEGEVFLVHPSISQIDGKYVYSDYRELPTVPDLAIIVLPSEYVVAEVVVMADSGTKSIVIYSAGFAEVGGIGEEMEEILLDMVEERGLTILGPNCLGFVSSSGRINATFSPMKRMPGNLRFLSQSGAIFSSIFDWSLGAGVGFDDVVSLGNKVSINENDLLEYWYDRPATMVEKKWMRAQGLSPYQPVGMYLESVVDGVEFIDLIYKTAKQNPVFVLRPGRTEKARDSMRLHTGAVAGDDAIFTSAMERSGAIRVSGMEDLFDLCRVFSWERAPDGPHVAIISNDGGPAIISADIMEEEGLILAELDAKTLVRLRELLPSTQSIGNPIEVGAGALAERYRAAIEIVISKPEVDALIVILSPKVMTEIEKTAEVIGAISKKYEKTILCSFVGGRAVSYGEDILNFYRVPTFRFPERAVRALGAMWRWNKWRLDAPEKLDDVQTLDIPIEDSDQIREILADANRNQHGILQSLDMFDIFDIIHIPVPPLGHADTVGDAKAFVREYGYPVVLKFAGPFIPHKRVLDLVEVDIIDDDALSRAYSFLKKNSKKLSKMELEDAGIDIQKEITGGVEVFVGVKYDEEFGNVLILGKGGDGVERDKHISIRTFPVSKTDIEEMFNEVDLLDLLVDMAFDQLIELIQRFIALAEDIPHFEEIEINPVIVTEDAVWAVDGKGLVEKMI
jgi:acetate---CoA ligase (ADP-forming)